MKQLVKGSLLSLATALILSTPTSEVLADDNIKSCKEKDLVRSSEFARVYTPNLENTGSYFPGEFVPGVPACGYLTNPLTAGADAADINVINAIAPILATCNEPIPDHIPDLRGTWQAYGTGLIQRIEQCGNRVVITGAGIIHDGFANASITGAVREVAHPLQEGGCRLIIATLTPSSLPDGTPSLIHQSIRAEEGRERWITIDEATGEEQMITSTFGLPNGIAVPSRRLAGPSNELLSCKMDSPSDTQFTY